MLIFLRLRKSGGAQSIEFDSEVTSCVVVV
jgi:hypothetical protein